MKKSILLIGGSSDIGKNFIRFSKFKENYNIISTSSKNLDLNCEESISNFIKKNNKTNINHILFLSAFNEIKNFKKLKNYEIKKAFNINFLGFITVLNNLIKTNKKLESIIIISSLYGIYGRKGRFLYSTSKHLLNGMIKTLCMDLSKDKIRVNGLTPGFIKTKMTSKNLNNMDIKKIKSKTPIGRLGKCKEITDVLDFLISKESSFVNGQNLIVDGGFSSGGFFE